MLLEHWLVERFEEDYVGVPPTEVTSERLPELQVTARVVGVVLKRLIRMVIVQIHHHCQVVSEQAPNCTVYIAEHGRVGYLGRCLVVQQVGLDGEPHAAKSKLVNEPEVGVAKIAPEVRQCGVRLDGILWDDVSNVPQPVCDVHAACKPCKPCGRY